MSTLPNHAQAVTAPIRDTITQIQRKHGATLVAPVAAVGGGQR